MSRANTIITRYRDEVGRLLTWSIDIGTDPDDDDYGPDVLVNDNPAQVAKIDSTSGAWLGTSATKQIVRFVGGPLHHNLDEGLDVVLQGSNGGSPFSATFEAPITIPAAFAPGTTQMWPVQPWVDLATVTPTLGSYDPAGFYHWRLYVRGTNSQHLQVGGVKLYSQYYVFESDFREGWTRTQSKPVILNKTAFNIKTKYTRGTTTWSSQGSLLTRSSQIADLEDHYFDTDGESRPFIVVPNALRNRCYFVEKMDGIFVEAVQFYNQDDDDEVIALPFTVEEVGRGLRPGI